MYNCGLILEGGGMRGVYTAGIIDYFLEKGLDSEKVTKAVKEIAKFQHRRLLKKT